MRIGNRELISLPALPEHVVSAQRLLPDVTVEELRSAKSAAPKWFGDSYDDVRFALHAYLIRGAGPAVLVDTGMTRDTPNAILAESLARADIAPDEVEYVVLTHRDIDHVGGTMKDGKPVYPNARHVMGRTEFEGFRADAARVQLFDSRIAPLLANGMLSIVEDDAEIVDGVRLWMTPGHTSGTANVVIDDQAIVLGDTWHIAVQVTHPDWASRFDQDRPMAEASRRRVIATARERGWVVAAPHTPGGGLGRVGRDWIPIT